MDISFDTTPGTAATDISNAPQSSPAPAGNDPRLAALRAAAAEIVAAAGVTDTDTVEVSLAMSDAPGWAVVRVAMVVRQDA